MGVFLPLKLALKRRHRGEQSLRDKMGNVSYNYLYRACWPAAAWGWQHPGYTYQETRIMLLLNYTTRVPAEQTAM